MPGENWSGHYDYLNRNKKKCKCEFSVYSKKEDVRSTLQSGMARVFWTNFM